MKPIYIKRDWNTHYSRRGLTLAEKCILWVVSVYVVAALLTVAWR